MTDQTTQPTIGDNLPPMNYSVLRERLQSDHNWMIARKDELLGGFDRAPNAIRDEETSGKVTDFIKQITEHIKKIEKVRVDEKEPYLKGGRDIDGFFKAISEPLDQAKRALADRLTTYQRAKATEERRIRQEEQRRAAEAARKAEQEAAEAAAAAQTDRDLSQAISHEERAQEAETTAHKAAVAAKAKSADLSRTRGDYGGVSSLRARWTGYLTDRGSLDLEQLRHHFSEDAMNQAIRSFVKAGGRELQGARIYEDQSTVVR